MCLFLLTWTTAIPQDRINIDILTENADLKGPPEITELNDGMLQRVSGKDSKLATYKTKLDNGFLIIEKMYQEWDTTYLDWVTNGESTFKYDININLPIELLSQNWDGSTWVNASKTTYKYNVNNNNLIETIRQFWDDSNWMRMM